MARPAGHVGDELLARLARLHTALVSDVLDRLGCGDQALDHRVRSVAGGGRVAGRAFPLASAAVAEREEPPYRTLLEAYPSIRPGDVVVLGTHGEARSGMWGELLSIAARARGAVGCVTDGLTRDVEGIEAIAFPVFARGCSPLDSAGRQAVYAYGEAVVCGGVEVRPGDVVLGDAMGVVVVPRELAEDAVRLAEEKRRGEDTVRQELARGEDIGAVFSRHGIL